MSAEAKASAVAVGYGLGMAEEADLKHSPTGVVPVGEGWFVLNARDARWHHAPGRSAVCEFEGETPFAQLGINISVLRPGQAMSQYHWEADQEDFLVLSGQALLIIEAEERPLRAWDLIHCPAGVSHVILGAGTNPCVVVAVGAREQSTGAEWGAYPVDPAAVRRRAGVERETTEPQEAYAGMPRRKPVAFDPDWLPESAV
ncbi:MAG: cupin domain-containing protein [Solirubrobacteraceae bacterium]